MRRHKTDAEITGHIVQHTQQLCEIHILVKAFSVRIDVLPKEGDFLISRIHKRTEFRKNVRAFPASFPSPHIRDNAIGTKVVAAVHNRQPRLKRLIPMNGEPLCDAVGGIRNILYAFFLR